MHSADARPSRAGALGEAHQEQGLIPSHPNTGELLFWVRPRARFSKDKQGPASWS